MVKNTSYRDYSMERYTNEYITECFQTFSFVELNEENNSVFKNWLPVLVLYTFIHAVNVRTYPCLKWWRYSRNLPLMLQVVYLNIIWWNNNQKC